MKFEEIYRFFAKEPVMQLSHHQAVCYILSVLLKGDSYGTDLIEKLLTEHQNYRLSDTVLYSALKFLETEGAIAGYWQKTAGRGRPRRMYQLKPQWRSEAQKLAHLWAVSVARDKAWSNPVLAEVEIGVPQLAAS